MSKKLNIFFMSIIVFFCLYPFLYTIAMSLSSAEAIMSGTVTIFPKQIEFEAYKRAFIQPNFLRAFLNSFLYAVSGTLISMILTIIAAYALSRKVLPGKKIILFFIMLTMFFPGGMIPSFLVVSKLNMIDTIWSQIIPVAITPYLLFMMIVFLKQVPDELEEAAMIDGVNPIQSLIHIVLPLSKPIIATVALFTALIQWNNWFSAMIYLSSPKKFPVMLVLKSIIEAGDMAMKGQSNINYDLMVLPTSIKSASVLLVATPIIILYIGLQKYFIKGLMIGAVKG